MLTKMWIDLAIIGLFEKYETETNDPYELCDLLEISIYKVDPEHSYLLGNNAVYMRKYFDGEAIFIRNDLNENHEIFYLRHEIGHAVLHVNVEDSSLCNKPKLEQQANYFAFRLGNISFDVIELHEMTIDQIASCLEVPLDPLKQLTEI